MDEGVAPQSHLLNRTYRPIASLILEVYVRPALHTDVASVGKIAHQADQRRTVLPYVAVYPPHNAGYGIEFPIAGDHFVDDSVRRQIFISRHRVGLGCSTLPVRILLRGLISGEMGKQVPGGTK